MEIPASDVPSADELQGSGLYAVKSAKYAHLPRALVEEAIANTGGEQRDANGLLRFEQVPVASNTVLRVRPRDDAFFRPHRQQQQAMQGRNGGDREALFTTLELASHGTDDVRPPDSMWRRVGVKWPAWLFAWVERDAIYIRPSFTPEDVERLNSDAWEWFDMHPKARVFHPKHTTLVTLFVKGAVPDGLAGTWSELQRAFGARATFRVVDATTFENPTHRYYIEHVPCLYVEYEGTGMLRRVVGRLRKETMRAAITAYIQ